MPRKATESVKPGEAGEATAAPRRSSRIKEQPKEVPAPKKTKPRVKKADKESADKEEKPKSRGKKRKAEDEAPNGDAEDTAAPTDKKVRFFF